MVRQTEKMVQSTCGSPRNDNGGDRGRRRCGDYTSDPGAAAVDWRQGRRELDRGEAAELRGVVMAENNEKRGCAAADRGGARRGRQRRLKQNGEKIIK